MKPQLDLRLHLLLVRHFRIMDKGTPTRIWGLVACGCVLETFDNGRFPAAVVADDDGNWGEEFNDGYLLVVEGAYAADG